MYVSWKELRQICLLLGCVEDRQKGDHLILTRPGLARPLVIKMDDRLGEDIVRSNMRTLGIDRKRFEGLLAQVRGHKKSGKGRKGK